MRLIDDGISIPFACGAALWSQRRIEQRPFLRGGGPVSFLVTAAPKNYMRVIKAPHLRHKAPRAARQRSSRFA